MDNPVHLLDESMSSEVDRFALELFKDDLLAEEEPGLVMDVDNSFTESCCELPPQLELAPPTSQSIPTIPGLEQESVQQGASVAPTPPSTSTTPTPTTGPVKCTFRDSDIQGVLSFINNIIWPVKLNTSIQYKVTCFSPPTSHTCPHPNSAYTSYSEANHPLYCISWSPSWK